MTTVVKYIKYNVCTIQYYEIKNSYSLQNDSQS